MHDAQQALDPLLPLSALVETLQRSRASIYRDVKRGAFPKPLKLGGSSRWRRSDVEAFIENLVSERDDA
jgi:predicted DNA-binding transcriptional regulator AlpA